MELHTQQKLKKAFGRKDKIFLNFQRFVKLWLSKNLHTSFQGKNLRKGKVCILKAKTKVRNVKRNKPGIKDKVGRLKKYFRQLQVLSLYYREGLVGLWIGFLLGLLVSAFF